MYTFQQGENGHSTTVKSMMCNHENTVTVLRPLPMIRRGIVSYQWKYDPKQIYDHLRGPVGLAHSSDLNNGNMNFHVQTRAGGGRCVACVKSRWGRGREHVWCYFRLICAFVCAFPGLWCIRKPLAEDWGLRTLTSNGLLTKQQVWIWYVCFLEGNVFKLKLLAPVRIFRLNLKLIDLFSDLLVCWNNIWKTGQIIRPDSHKLSTLLFNS